MNDEIYSNLPNNIPYINPFSISNSGNKYFTNPKSKIYKLSVNILTNSNTTNYDIKKKINSTSNNSNSTNNNTQPDLISILNQQKNNSKNEKLK